MSVEVRRALTLLSRPGAWVAEEAMTYRVRLTPDRRRRPALVLSEADFLDLAGSGALAARVGGGWRLARTAPPSQEPPDGAGRPGMVQGERMVMDPDGRMTPRRANLGESPIAWLARRRDAGGRPWLDAAEAAAGERLRMDAELAWRGPALTMRWDDLPRAGAGSGAPPAPGQAARAAADRVHAALGALPPAGRALVERICVHGSALQAAEQGMGLRRRTGKIVLKAALGALARHYRL